jgi:hypothetical protein
MRISGLNFWRQIRLKIGWDSIFFLVLMHALCISFYWLFVSEQVDSIKKVKLSGLLCEHFSLDTIQRDPFQIERPGQCPGST